MEEKSMIAFGPIPSRRLGQSLGINHIPPKNCTFNCVYCQVGTTTHLGIKRRAFYPPDEVFRDVENRVNEVIASGGHIDYISLVPDGESTIDINLGEIIRKLRKLPYKIALITNASMLWREDVRNEIMDIDCISIKVDSVIEEAWRAVNRPNPMLSLPEVLDGIRAYVRSFKGLLLTETMLVEGINDSQESLEATASFLAEIHPDKAYLIVPTRPPAESWVEVPDEANLNRAYQIYKTHGLDVELLTGFSPEDFSTSGDLEEELLSITAVHPLRESEAVELITKAGGHSSILESLVGQGKLTRTIFDGIPFYLRKLPVKAAKS